MCDKMFTAGDYQAVGLDAAGLSQAQANHLVSDLQAIQAQFHAKNFSSLTKHDLAGAILRSGLQRYFLQTLGNGQLAAKPAGIVQYRLPSFGTMSTNTDVSLFFGVPFRASPLAILIDMDRIAIASVNYADDSFARQAFNQAQGGMASRYESAVLEREFSIPQELANGSPDRSLMSIAISVRNALRSAAHRGTALASVC